MRLKRAVFLDRDGTLNQDVGYTHRISEWVWLPGTVGALKKLQKAGWLLVVASNQSGIGRGYYGWQDLQKLEGWVNTQLALAGVNIAGWYYCPHLPADGCSCRKPQPGLLLKAASELGIDLNVSWMLGDKISDIQAGLAAGCSSGMVANSCNRLAVEQVTSLYPDVPVWASLAAAADTLAANSDFDKHGARNFA